MCLQRHNSAAGADDSALQQCSLTGLHVKALEESNCCELLLTTSEFIKSQSVHKQRTHSQVTQRLCR